MSAEERIRAVMAQAWNVPVFFGPPADEGSEKPDMDKFPQAMIEGSTEYDWEDLPEWLKDVMRHAADEFRRWADVEPLKGEVVTDVRALLGAAPDFTGGLPVDEYMDEQRGRGQE